MIEPNWKLIETENPHLAIDSVEQIGEGWSCLGYLVNQTHVFKVPKLDCWDELMAEILFLTTVGEQLPLPTPQPHYHRRVSAAAPFGYAVSSYIAGGNLLLADLSSERRQAVVADLASFLRTLHDLEPPSALRQILYVEDHLSLADTARRLLKAAETAIAPTLSSRELHTLRREFARQAAHYAQPFTPRLLHRDFCTDNIRMVDGAIAGVIDFGNIVLGDPDLEFAEIYLEQGEAVLREIAQHYGHHDPNALVEKMWRVSIVNQVEVIIDDAEDAPAGVVEETRLTLRRLLQEA